MNGIQIKTEVHGDLIVQETTGPGMRHAERELIMRRVMHTKDQLVRAALVQLGWVPPEKAQSLAAEEREKCAKQLDALGCDHCAAALRRGGH
jgi:hypothetical protein